MNPTRREIISLLKKEDFQDIYRKADRIRKEAVGDVIHIRALLEFSNHCRRQCLYCGLNRTNSMLPRFRLTPDEIVDISYKAYNAGYRTIVLQSGEDGWFTQKILGDIIRRIKACGIAITLSCGEFPPETYRYFKECGADRYLLKHETSDSELYASLHPDSTLATRINCLQAIKKAGMETGGGFMIGLPGQTLEIIADDLLLLKEIGCDMAGIGPFLPHPDTLLRNAVPGSAELTARAVAIARLLLPKANLPATTSLGVLDWEQKQNVFRRGANVIMQKVTPSRVKRLYEIYPSKLPDTDVISDRKAIEESIRQMGRIPK